MQNLILCMNHGLCIVFMHIENCISHGLCTQKKSKKKKPPEATILTKTSTCTCINHGLCTKNAFCINRKKMLAFAMANTNSAHPCMNHGKCKLKITVFPMGNANLRFFVFAMANTHLKMHLPWQIQTKKRCFLVLLLLALCCRLHSSLATTVPL